MPLFAPLYNKNILHPLILPQAIARRFKDLLSSIKAIESLGQQLAVLDRSISLLISTRKASRKHVNAIKVLFFNRTGVCKSHMAINDLAFRLANLARFYF